MEQININDKDVIIMNLVHYFVTEREYNPVVVHGINDEIWLENMKEDYKIIRIVSKYIHNNEQLEMDKYRYRQIAKKLRFKTFTLNLNVLNLYIDLGDNVTELKETDGHDAAVFINEIKAIDNPILKASYPDIMDKTKHDEEGMQLLFKITEDINLTNERKNKRMEKIFSEKKPIMTYILIGLCILMFILTIGGVNTDLLLKYGANSGVLVRNGQIYRLITHMFLHGGLFHIFFNMYALYVLGPKIEDFFGKWKFLAIYLISGICGGLLSIALNPDVIAVGASGAIFGLFGALLFFGYSYRGYVGAMVRSQILPAVIINLSLGFFISGIDVWSHIGGLIAGILIANMLGTIENKKYNVRDILLFVIYFGFIVYLGLFR